MSRPKQIQTTRFSIRTSTKLLDLIDARAIALGVNRNRYIRSLIHQDIYSVDRQALVNATHWKKVK
jgi:predicted DNA binding CopG/RHH family protein